MNGHITCVMCPVGCKIKVRKEGLEYVVEGNKCVRGKNYALDEIASPKRVLTTSVRVLGGDCPLVSVKTSKAMLKKIIMDKMALIRELRVLAPVSVGDKIVEDIDGDGTDLLATREIKKI